MGVELLDKARAMTNNEDALNAIKHLEKVFELLKAYGFDKYVTFDLGMLSELDYYTGVIFSAYTYDVGEPVAKGGRYDKLIGQFGKQKASIGFCITIDLLHQAIKRQKISLPVQDKGKLIIYKEENLYDAVKLATFFRNSGVTATLLTEGMMFSDEKYEEVIKVDNNVLERYGIK